jgi:hypothetical protein
VVATIDNGNYTGSATAQMVIGTAAGAATITLGSLTATYDGSAHSATATANPAGLTVNITYDGSATAPTNAGTYAVAATVDQVVAGIRYTGTATAQLVISNCAATITLGSLTATYDGSAHSATATANPAGLTVDLTYDGSTSAPVHAGSYVVLAVVNDPNYTGTTTDTLVIGKATAAVNLGSLTLTYLGTPLRPTANTSPVGLSTQLTFNGSLTAPSSAGSYTVVATVTDPDYDGTATVTFQIAKASTALTLSDTAATYDGTSHAVTVTSVPTVAGLTVTYDGSATPPSDAGIYGVTATVDDPNRQGTASGTLVISPADATVGITGVDPVYDGRQHPVVVTTDPAGLTVTVTYNGSTTAPFSAGTYTVVATVTNPNYTGTASARYTMHPAPIAPVLVSGAPPEILPGDGTAIDGSGNVLPVTVTVSATTGGNTVELTDGFITLNVDPIDPGSITSNPDGSQTLAVGKTVSVTGNGFDPFSIVQIWMFSQPRLLATVRVGADGSFVQPVLVPTDLAVGDHTMQVHGYDHHHTHRSLQVGVRIAARQTGVLPATGTASMHLIELAFALLGLGLALRRLARRTASVR